MAKLKQFLTESEITDDLKGAYTLVNGRYELNQLDNEHSVVKALSDIKTKDGAKQTQIDALTADKGNLERERDELKSKATPSGFRAVKKDVAELGELAEQNGFTKETIPTVTQELAALKNEKAESSKKDILTKAAKAAGVKNLEDFFSRKATDNLNIVAEKDGDKEKFYTVATVDGKEVKTVFDKEYISKADGYKSGAAALFAGDDNQWVDQDSGDFDSGNEFDQYRKEVQLEQKNVQPRDNQSVLAALNGQAIK